MTAAARRRLLRAVLGRAGRAKRSRGRTRALRVLAALVLAPVLTLVVLAMATPFPEELRARPSPGGASVVFTDRNGGVLREVRDAARARAATLAEDEIGPVALAALVAAEDRRFFVHPGVDPVAGVRAAAAAVWHRRIVSGASTLTMQLARLVVPHPKRTLRGKIAEAALALRIEASLPKRRILVEYANRAPFGGDVRGIGAASRIYFDKPPTELSVAEAATLAALPRGPTLYSMQRRLPLVKRRRDRVLARMHAAGVIDDETLARALAEPLSPRLSRPAFGAPHLVVSLASGKGALLAGGLDVATARRVTTTIDPGLQAEAESIVRGTLAPLAERHVGAASVVVIDNASGEVLAYVGSPAFDDARHLGQNDGVVALRQPGSTLKPFVYGLAMERLGLHGASLLADVELAVDVPSGVYRPTNYDGRFHGPVRLREALGSSYNVPAVEVVLRIGEDTLLARLRELGMTSLGNDAGHYGPALALGDGEVRLLDLANAYATLARGGVHRPVVAVRAIAGSDGALARPRDEVERRVFPRVVAAQLTDILRDKAARVPSFGERSALELPFPVAVKTGTSKGFRDNFTVGFTDRVTVAVWVGNFDGTPMQGVSGVTGAGPIFRGVLTAAMRGHESDDLAAAGAPTLHDETVCALSGAVPHEGCLHTAHERLPEGAIRNVCMMHEIVELDRRNGLLATEGCPRGVVQKKTFERYPPELVAWASAAKRPLAPVEVSSACGGAHAHGRDGHLQIASPREGARFVRDPDRPLSQQTIPVRIAGTAGARLVLYVDGAVAARGTIGEPLAIPMTVGEHVLVAHEESGARSEPVRVRVD